MRIHDGIIGAGFTLAGAAIFARTLAYPRLEGGAPGPALFPQVLAVLMVGFGVCLVVPAVSGLRRQSAEEAPTDPGPGSGGIVNALLVFVAIIVFMLVSPPVGFLLPPAALLLGLMWWLGTPVVRAALAAAGLTLFVYVIFGKVLRVPLPLGLLWF